MAGYSGYSMSNNAVDAYCRGLVPASKIKRVPTALIEKYVIPNEWHHCSKNYNRVNFYDPDEVLAIFGLEPSEDYEVNPNAVADLAAYKASKNNLEVHENCTVEWLEWHGSLRRPKALERKETGCKVSIKGQTATITFANGSTMTKRLSTNGFHWRKA